MTDHPRVFKRGELDPDCIPSRPRSVDFEIFGDEILVLQTNPRRTTLLNPSASLVFGLCDGKQTLDQVIAAVAAFFPDSGRNIAADVKAILRRALDDGFLILDDADADADADGERREARRSAISEPSPQSPQVVSTILPREPPAAPADRPISGAGDIVETIERLASLRQKGILTEEEFAAKKAELLRRL